MGWKSKFLFLLIVYFSGFATAIYYLAPPGENQQEANYENAGTATSLNHYGKIACSKVATGITAMSKYDFKGAYDRGILALQNMKQNCKPPPDEADTQ